MALTNRSVFRKALAALIDANANFKVVYDYMPDLGTLKMLSPAAIVTSGGTTQQMLSLHTIP